MMNRSEDDVYLIKEFLHYWDKKCLAKSDGAQVETVASTPKRITPAAYTLLSDNWRNSLDTMAHV